MWIKSIVSNTWSKRVLSPLSLKVENQRTSIPHPPPPIPMAMATSRWLTPLIYFFPLFLVPAFTIYIHKCITSIHIYIYRTCMQILLQPLAVMCTWKSQDACALSRHCEPCKQSSWSQARNSQENRSFLAASRPEVSPGPLLLHEKKGLEFAPQQMPGPQSQLGGLVGGRWKTRWKIAWGGT